jgi:hypothetical protein
LVAGSLDTDDRRVQADAVAGRGDLTLHALIQAADARAGVEVLGEVRRRIGLDAQRSQDDVLEIQLRDALGLLRRDLAGRQSPDA